MAKFPSELASRGTVLVTDKLLIHNISTGATEYTTVTELFAALVVTGSVSCGHATPTTLFTLPGNGMYHVFVYGVGPIANDTINYSAYAVILKEGTSQRIAIQNNAVLNTITLSGANVQATQASGDVQNINYAYHRVI